MTGDVSVREATADDADALARIYNHYIRETVITFEIDEVDAGVMVGRVAKLQAAGLPWLVAVEGAALLGYAYAAPYRERAAYVHALETSVYLDPEARGKGVGTALFERLFSLLSALDARQSPHAPVHAIVGGIALPNDASIALHERFGMTHLGTFTEVGRKFDRWIDVGYWQATLR